MKYVIYYNDEVNPATRVTCKDSLEYAESHVRVLIGNKKIVHGESECGESVFNSERVARYEVYEEDMLLLDDYGHVVDFRDPVYVSDWFLTD